MSILVGGNCPSRKGQCQAGAAWGSVLIFKLGYYPENHPLDADARLKLGLIKDKIASELKGPNEGNGFGRFGNKPINSLDLIF